MNIRAKNHFEIEVECNPIEEYPFYLTFSYDGDPNVYARFINVIQSSPQKRISKFSYLFIFPKWRFVNPKDWVNYWGRSLPLKNVIENRQRFIFATHKKALEAKKEIGELLNNLVIKEGKQYESLVALELEQPQSTRAVSCEGKRNGY